MTTLNILQDADTPADGHCGTCNHFHADGGHEDGHCQQPELVPFDLHVMPEDGCNRFEPEPQAAS